MKYTLMLLLLCGMALCTLASLPDLELTALRALYQSTGGDKWTDNSGWLQTGNDPCHDWFGVACTDDGNHVNALSLSNNNLVGTIPSEIGYLDSLISIDFGLNKLTGTIPPSFWQLSKMYAISLKENQLSGELDFYEMPNMQYAHLDFNNFNGTLDGFCGCQNLKVLGLTNNNIGESIPDCFASFTQLQTLQLSGNQLKGSIPAFTAESLRGIDLSRNSLSGSPAMQMFNKTKLTELVLFKNKLSGSIAGLSGHTSMVVFDVHDNIMNGNIPEDYATNIPNLLVLHAQKNNLRGFLPDTFNQTSIASFDFSDNKLYCPLPTLPAGGAATCKEWSLSLVNPSRCTVGELCFAVVMGQGFVVGEKAECFFGNDTTYLTRVKATIVSSRELRCVFKPTVVGRTRLAIRVGGRVVTSNPLRFEFIAKSHAGQQRRSANSDAVKVRIHGESKCPDFGDIVKIFRDNVTTKLGPDFTKVMDLQLGFIMKEMPDYPTGFWSLHGQSEVIGNGMIKCVEQKTDVATAVKFSACLAETIDTVPTNAAECASRLGIDFSDIPQCALGEKGRQLLKDSMVLADNDGAVWSPTILIDDKPYCLWHSTPCKASKPEDFLRAICDAYKGDKPEACK